MLVLQSLLMSLSGGGPKLILGSGSMSRQNILQTASIPFLVRSVPIDEKGIGNRQLGTMENVRDLVVLLGRAKAEAVLAKHGNDVDLQDHVLVTADQVVFCNNQILEKPQNSDEAAQFIQMHSDFSCSTVGSLVLTHIPSRRQVVGVDTATIWLHPLPKDVVNTLANDPALMHCAGALMSEHTVLQPYIQRIDGSLDSVMGLSLELLQQLYGELLDGMNGK